LTNCTLYKGGVFSIPPLNYLINYLKKYFYMLSTFRISNKILIAGLFSLLLFSCGGGDDDDIEVIEELSNLVINAEIQGVDASNPYGDGTGIVNFTFSAENATSYKINFGNGEVVETSNTALSYTFIGAGINDFEVFISAYKGSEFISSSINVKVEINSSLLWSDEFNGTGSPDSNKWNYDIGKGDNGWGNGEAQYYTNRLENVKVENGYLIITAKKENY